jgi:hypothetical protein
MKNLASVMDGEGLRTFTDALQQDFEDSAMEELLGEGAAP